MDVFEIMKDECDLVANFSPQELGISLRFDEIIPKTDLLETVTMSLRSRATTKKWKRGQCAIRSSSFKLLFERKNCTTADWPPILDMRVRLCSTLSLSLARRSECMAREDRQEDRR